MRRPLPFVACLCVFVTIAVMTSLAGSGNEGFADGLGTQASFNFPVGMAVDASGTVFVADWRNHRIRVISPTGGTWGLCIQQRLQCGGVASDL